MKTFVLRDKQVLSRVQAYLASLDGLYEVVVRPYKANRTLEQNALMWSVLTEISEQVEWHGQYLSKEEWKDILTAALKRQKVVPGIDGGFVVLGTSTRKLPIADMTELIELAFAFGAQHGVRFDEREAA
jgi:hypothetical protein